MHDSHLTPFRKDPKLDANHHGLGSPVARHRSILFHTDIQAPFDIGKLLGASCHAPQHVLMGCMSKT